MASPSLADIYSFMDGGGNAGNPYIDPYNTDGGDSGHRIMQGYGGENLTNMYETSGGKEGWGGTAEEWLKKNNVKYTLEDDWRRGEGASSGDKMANIDWGSLPKTKFGNVNQTMPMNYRGGQAIKGRKAVDPRMVYDDPNYGKITHAMNVQDKSNWMDYLPQVAMAAGSMGFGALGPAAMAGMSAVNAARAAGSGDWKGAAMSVGSGLLGAGLGGMNPQMAQALSYAKRAYGAYNTGRSLSNMYSKRGG